MPRRGKRVRLSRGIFEDPAGRSGIISIDGKPKELRFAIGTPLKEIRAEMAKQLAKHKGSGKAASGRATLDAAINRWEGLEQHLASWKERRAELRAWGELYGTIRFRALDADDVRKAIGRWTAEGLAAKTIRNRLWSLKHLYRVLLGKRAETPVDDVDPPAKVRTVINPTSVDVILTVYENLLQMETPQGFTVDGHTHRLRDAKTRARFMVRASTGRRPVEIMRATPADVDLERRIWRVRDAKGGWSEGIYLSDDMLTAWRTFTETDAWGWFNTGSQAEVLRAAGWPDDSRPYNLRHSVGIGLSELGHDLDDVGGWLGHKPGSKVTRESYVPILNSRMQRLGESLDGRLKGWNMERIHGTPVEPTT